MPFSKDITMYPTEEQDLVMAALSSPITIECDTDKEATYLRARIYAIRSAAIYNWEKKQKLEKLGLDTSHLNKPIVTCAQEVMSINVQREGKKVTIGRRLGKKSLQDKIVNALRERGAHVTSDDMPTEADFQAMADRIRANLDPNARPDDPMTDTLKQLGFTATPPKSNDENT